MASTKSVATFLFEVRRRIDEELDPSTNFWKDTELVELMNEGCREVWQTIREAHEDRFVRTLRSTDGSVNLAGRDYDTGLLTMKDGRGEIILPPDFHELLLFEMKPPDDGHVIRRYAFQHADLASRNFRENVMFVSSTASTVYFYNIEWRDGMAVMVLVPTPQLDTESMPTQMKYVQAPRELTKTDTFENTGFEPFMLDAVKAYVKWSALSKGEGVDPNAITRALNAWEEKRLFALRACGPKQSRDPVLVEGPYEEEW